MKLEDKIIKFLNKAIKENAKEINKYRGKGIADNIYCFHASAENTAYQKVLNFIYRIGE